jgi:ribosomal protein S1
MPNPWDDLAIKFNPGKMAEGTIKAIVDFGLFVDLGEEVDALIHVSDISWTKKTINLNEEFKVGQKIKAVVVTVDKENQKFCLGLKQLGKILGRGLKNVCLLALPLKAKLSASPNLVYSLSLRLVSRV